MMKRGVLLFGLVLLLAGASPWRAGVQLQYFSVEPQGDSFMVTWVMSEQDGVDAFVLLRKTPYSGGTYKEIKRVDQVEGVGQVYSYLDRDLYKAAAEQVDYRLDVELTGGSREMIADESMEYRPTAVRRTWGSIKAMFQ